MEIKEKTKFGKKKKAVKLLDVPRLDKIPSFIKKIDLNVEKYMRYQMLMNHPIIRIKLLEELIEKTGTEENFQALPSYWVIEAKEHRDDTWNVVQGYFSDAVQFFFDKIMQLKSPVKQFIIFTIAWGKALSHYVAFEIETGENSGISIFDPASTVINNKFRLSSEGGWIKSFFANILFNKQEIRKKLKLPEGLISFREDFIPTESCQRFQEDIFCQTWVIYVLYYRLQGFTRISISNMINSFTNDETLFEIKKMVAWLTWNIRIVDWGFKEYEPTTKKIPNFNPEKHIYGMHTDETGFKDYIKYKLLIFK